MSRSGVVLATLGAVVVLAGAAVGAALLVGPDGTDGSGKLDRLAATDPIAAIELAADRVRIPWGAAGGADLQPRCSPVDEFLGWNLVAELRTPAGWDAPPELTAPGDTSVEWRLAADVTVVAVGDVVQVAVDVDDALVEDLRTDPRVDSVEAFICG